MLKCWIAPQIPPGAVSEAKIIAQGPNHRLTQCQSVVERIGQKRIGQKRKAARANARLSLRMLYRAWC
jgi:ribosomal protein S20